MSPHEQIQREVERDEADFRVPSLDENGIVPIKILPAPMPGRRSSKQMQQIAERDYQGWVAW